MAARPASHLAPRPIITLLVSLLVTLASGTNYVFSAYAPQLAARLHISHTQLNAIALAGNVGVYFSSPLWGITADKLGPKLNLFPSFCFLLAGYSGIWIIYDNGISAFETSASTSVILLLVFFTLMTGVGGSGGYMTALNVTARSFPDSLRGSALGLVVSGFGLSAFLFSFIAQHAFPGQTSYLLLTLALGTALPLLIGVFVIQPIPLLVPSTHESVAVEADDIDSRTPLISSISQNVIAESSVASESSSSRGSNQIGKKSMPEDSALLKHFHGRKLFASVDFWILFCNFSLVSGVGLMYINNVGSIAQVLYIHEHPSNYNQIEISKWQATQVSTISTVSFSGRIFIGILSDLVKARWNIPRSYLLVLVPIFALASQITLASYIIVVSGLWISSALLGLGYGMLFSLSTAIVTEWFGLAHFSETLGFLTLSPLIGGNVFSIAFGRNLDKHSNAEIPTNVSLNVCLDGRSCYVDTLYLTITGCMVAVFLSLWAAWRDRIRRAEWHERQFSG
ncbi:major facilitator superfamily domain-containing protein [Rhodocollybia butyracea]|uniref:Major facilitator superfamily domain-containing protein n=1 Tax=Rhodocollybia butyracea TaxID=206335 RepID=A0A9P5PEX3_9AGAR|nr:major facilitator superfamily domain-containing protein [Rhodocollybia butyracea]